MKLPSLKHDTKAEKAIIGTLMFAGRDGDSDCLDTIFDLLKQEDFFDPRYRAIFATASSMHAAREPIDAQLVAKRSKVSQAALVLLEALEECVSTAHVHSYAKVLADCSKQRAVVTAALDALKEDDHAEAARIMRDGLAALDKDDRSQPLVTAEEATANYLSFLEHDYRALQRTALPELDYALGGGVDFGEMIVLAARPSHGKTAIALQFAHNLTQDGITVLYVSLEMSAAALGKRIMQYSSSVPEEKWRSSMGDVRGHVADYHGGRADILIADRHKTLDAVVREVERTVKTRGVRAVVIDYAQLIQSPGKSRYESITHISTVLRGLASELNIVMLVLAQMSREIESRKKFVPIMSDIKESGQFEQDADVVVFLVWPHRIDHHQPAHEYQFFVAKNRSRPILASAFVSRFEPSRQRVVSPRSQDMDNYESAFADSDPYYLPE